MTPGTLTKASVCLVRVLIESLYPSFEVMPGLSIGYIVYLPGRATTTMMEWPRVGNATLDF